MALLQDFDLAALDNLTHALKLHASSRRYAAADAAADAAMVARAATKAATKGDR